MTEESKAEQVVDKVAEAAGIAGLVPSPATIPLEIFSAAWPTLGPEVIGGFFALFSKLHRKAKYPNAAGAAALKAAQDAARESAPEIEDDIDGDLNAPFDRPPYV